MLGKIIEYNEETELGMIQVNRSLFEFSLDQCDLPEPPRVDDDVFIVIDSRKNKLLEVHSAEPYMPKGDPVKSKLIAGLLGIFLGMFGAGRLYLGYYKIGVMQMIVTIASLGVGGVGIIWPFFDAVLILTGNVIKDGKGRPLK